MRIVGVLALLCGCCLLWQGVEGLISEGEHGRTHSVTEALEPIVDIVGSRTVTTMHLDKL